MNFGVIFNQSLCDQEFEKLERENAAETKRLNGLIESNDKARKKLSREIGDIQAEMQVNNDELCRCTESEKRPWGIVATYPRIHMTQQVIEGFVRGQFDMRAALKASSEIEKRKCELKAENLVLLCRLEPLQDELALLNTEHLSLSAQLNEVRQPDYKMFQLNWKRMQALQASGIQTDMDYLGDVKAETMRNQGWKEA